MKWHFTFMRIQWPFWLAGLLIGIAEVLYYVKTQTFITFTTSIGQMFAGLETLFFHHSMMARAFSPDINWVLIGVIIGGSVVAAIEREYRFWVKYNAKALMFAFFGAALFSMGTRLAGGCTTHHVLGGIPAMNIASLIVSVIMFLSSFLGLWLYQRAGLGVYFKPQENKWFAKQAISLNLQQEATVYDAAYRPARDVRWIILVMIALMFLLLIIGAGVFMPWQHGLRTIGAATVLLYIGIGLIATGFFCTTRLSFNGALSGCRYDGHREYLDVGV